MFIVQHNAKKHGLKGAHTATYTVCKSPLTAFIVKRLTKGAILSIHRLNRKIKHTHQRLSVSKPYTHPLLKQVYMQVTKRTTLYGTKKSQWHVWQFYRYYKPLVK